MDINLLVKISSRAWSLTILSLMHQGIPGRQASLISASGAGRTAFSQSLAHLVNLDLMEKNPGHGHPLRPEFRLTSLGIEMAGTADRIIGAVPQHNQRKIIRRAWSVPVLVVSQKPLHFSQIRSQLVSITDRALSQTLDRLQGQTWLRREVDTTTRPPRPLYQAINAGALISQAIEPENM